MIAATLKSTAPRTKYATTKSKTQPTTVINDLTTMRMIIVLKYKHHIYK